MKKIIGILLIALGFSYASAQKKEAVELNPLLGTFGTAPVGGGFSMEGYWVWCGSVIKGDDGMYHMYASRWPKTLPFHPGWMVASEIVHAVSKTPEGPFQFSEVALPARGAQYWDGRATHNPRVVKYKDTYILYYMGSTHPFDEITNPDTLNLQSPYATVARANKRIGIATSKSPFGPWERRNEPVLDTKADTYYSFLTSNPAPLIEEDGSVLLVFKARAYKNKYPFQGDMSLGVARAPHFNGPYQVATPEPIFSMNRFGEVEDPYIWKDDKGYHMIAKDQRGMITGKSHSGIAAFSKDGIHWEPEKNSLAYTKVINWSDGKTIEMGQLERAAPLFENGKITHVYFATMDGPGGFARGTKSWNMVVPVKNDAGEKAKGRAIRKK